MSLLLSQKMITSNKIPYQLKELPVLRILHVKIFLDGTALQVGRLVVRLRMGRLEFFVDLIFRPH
jgi:hypothetical protein